ncbi:uncharacterized protein [Dermacentor albipictus]|uniref:uncharacterized protein isoform X3 n=1 Tax=Dermacentor albipictus TaxID=60249 RepID=UPI0031FD40BE
MDLMKKPGVRESAIMAKKLLASTVLLIILLSMPSLSQVAKREYELLSEEGKQVTEYVRMRNGWNYRQADFIMRAKHGVPAIFLIATYSNKTVDRSLSDYYYILGAQPSCYVMAALEPTGGKGRALCMYWIKEGTINETHTACDASYGPCRSIGGAVYNLREETCDFGND